MSFELALMLKTTAVFMGAALLSLALRRASASARHTAWSLGFWAVLALPLASTLLPSISLPLLKQNAEIGPATLTPGIEELPFASNPDFLAKDSAVAVADASGIEVGAAPKAFRQSKPWTARELLRLAWGLGALLVLIRAVAGAVQVRRLKRLSTPAETSDILLAELQRELLITQPVDVRIGSDEVPPMTWGILRHVILLPRVSERWTIERSRLVLAHELAHVKRHDGLMQILVQLACSVYWFNPLVWFAAHRLRIERERACDDTVLSLGADASDYAGHLLEIARDINTGFSVATMSIAHPRQLESRLRAILDPKTKRRSLSRVHATAILTSITLLTTLIAAVQVTALAHLVPPVSMASAQLPVTVERGGLAGTTLRGIVVDASTQRPISEADVIRVFAQTNPTAPPPTQTLAVDSGGRFEITGLNPGAYAFLFSSPGYVQRALGSWPGQRGEPEIQLEAGETKSITVALTPMSNVSGNVMDTEERPLAGISIQILQLSYNGFGQRVLRAIAEKRTDDRGEFRVHWIPPGRYYVLARNAASTPFGRAGSSNEVPGQGVAPTYYPNATNVSQATPIDLKPGMEIGGIRFSVERRQAHRIRGKVVDAATGRPPDSATVWLVTVSSNGGTSRSTNGRNYNAAEGTFDIRDVAPGPHFVSVEVTDPDLPPLPRVAPVSPIAGGISSGGAGGGGAPGRVIAMTQVPVTVMDSDIDNVFVTINAPAAVRGRLTIDRQPIPAEFGEVRLQLWPWANAALVMDGSGPPAVVVQSDGTFTVEGVKPGEYRVAVAVPNPSAYIQEARFGPAEALDNPLSVTSGDASQLNVAVSLKGAQLDGTVVDEKLQPAPNVQAVLVPDQHRDRPDLYRNVTADRNGRFNMRSIPPGNYKLFAWRSLEPFSYFDPSVIQRYEGQGRAIHLLESAHDTVQVKVTP